MFRCAQRTLRGRASHPPNENAALWAAFGWRAHLVDGHDLPELCGALSGDDSSAAPRVVLAQTVFGRGVSFMERAIKWHYMPMNDDEYRQALDQVNH